MLSLSQYLFPRLTQAKQFPFRLGGGGGTTVWLVVVMLVIVMLAVVLLAIVLFVMVLLAKIVLLLIVPFVAGIV
jgi:hypothetical protein